MQHAHEHPKDRRTAVRVLATLTLAVAAVGGVALAGAGHGTAHHHQAAAPASESAELGGHTTKLPGGPPATRTGLGRPPLSAQAKFNSHGVPAAERHARIETGEEVEDRETKDNLSDPASPYQLLGHTGNLVQTAPRIWLVFWGPNWFNGGDPKGVANRLHYFYSGLGGSGFNNVLKQYRGSNGSFTNPTGQYKGWLQDNTPVPARPTKADMAAAAQRAAARVNDSGYNAQFVIATPWGVLDQFSQPLGGRISACAWHDWTTAIGYYTTYTSMPYTPYLAALGQPCGTNAVNGNVLDGVTINADHEYAETVTDPELSSWFDGLGGENADKCSWYNLANRTEANGSVFPIQPTWGNDWRVAYGNGCYYSI